MSKAKKIKIILVVLITLSAILFSLTMLRSGLKNQFGLGFWGPNGHDAIWHLSLINQLKQQVPPQNPIYSGELLSNYHWGFDFFVAFISNLTKIDTVLLYFQILPIVFALLLGFLSFKLAFLITKNNITSILFVILNYFSGSFGWIYTLLKNHQLGGESLFWSMQSVSTLLNPPFALSLILILFGLTLWCKYYSSNSIKFAILIGLIFGLLSGIKVYAGILIGLALSLHWLFNAIKSKKIFGFNFTVCLTTGLVSLLIVGLLGVLQGNSLLEFKPLWFTHSMIESIDKLYWPKLASFRFNQTNIFISIFIEIILVLIFLIGNLGTRFLAFFEIYSKILKKKLNHFDNLIIFVLIFSFLIPLLFVQKGTAWNTIQFFYYFLFFANFYFAQFLSNHWSKHKILVILLLFISSITTIGTLKDYFGNPPPSSLPNSEIEALNFLKNQDNGFVLTFPYDKYKKDKMITPIPLYAYETTAYVSAFSHKQTFLEDEMNLDITGFNWQQRRTEEEKFFSTADQFFARGFLNNNNIKYIYLVADQNFTLSTFDLQIDEIFNNGQVRIYQTRK
ncbi:MAG: hypothetical protein PHE32_02610 [Candidatus Shapirobacteria bacterium]|nr:hypothetical protein [Candidatus Shapirobacteria bacterium]MDD4410564.1 hypothetical protein [Candidatus Shapirobacteria bacterium]